MRNPKTKIKESQEERKEHRKRLHVMTRKFATVAASFVGRRSPVKLHTFRTPPAQSNPDGNFPPLVIMHGILGSESTYRSIQKRPDFAPFHEKIGIDLCNHGSSPRVLAHEMTFDNMSDDVIALLDSLDIPKATLLGHSMGGKVAMQTALTYPDRVNKLIVVDIAPVTYKPGNHPSDSTIASRAMAAIDLTSVKTRKDVDQLLQQQGISIEAVRQFLLTNLTTISSDSQNSQKQYQWKSNVNEIVDAIPHLLSFPDHEYGVTYDGKTCVIRGGKSNYVPFQAMRTFTKLFPKTKLVTISDAGHWVQAQMPDEFCQSVTDFLDD